MRKSYRWRGKCMKIKTFRCGKSARRWGYQDRRFIGMCGSKKESKNKLAPAQGCRKSTVVHRYNSFIQEFTGAATDFFTIRCNYFALHGANVGIRPCRANRRLARFL